MRKNLREYFLEKLQANLRFLLILAVSLLEVFLNIGRKFPGDSYQYLNFALFFLRRGGYVSPYVAMRPMVPFLASTLSLVFGNFHLGNLYLSFGLVSGFFWVSGAIVAYKIGELILGEKDLATALSLSYTTAPVLLLTGAAVLTDSAGFFFIGLTIYLTLKRERTKAISSKTHFLDAFVCSVGIFFRESVVFALLFMLSRRLIKKKGFVQSLCAMLLVGFVFLAYLHLLGFETSIFLRKYSLSQQMAQPESWSFLVYTGCFASAFVTSALAPKPYFVSADFWVWALPIFFYCAFSLVGFLFSKRKKDLLMVLLFLLPGTVVWPEMSLRFSFSIWPAVIPAMISGMNVIFSRLSSLTKRVSHGSEFFIFLFIIILAVINTVTTLTSHRSLTIARR